MAKTNDPERGEEYLHHYLERINSELNQYQTQLDAQKSSYPMPDVNLDQMDQSLNKFIDSQRNDLLIRNHKELTRFKAQIALKESSEWVSSLSLSSDQVSLCEVFDPRIIVWVLIFAYSHSLAGNR